MPLISIVIPVYNLAKYLEGCVKSIQQQNLQDWELILVDDGSIDSSLEIIKRIAAGDNRIVYVANGTNQGPMIAREMGYRIAHGHYITFVDGDDTLPPDSLNLLYEEAIKSNADIVVGDIITIDFLQNEIPFRTDTSYGLFEKKDITLQLLNGSLPHNLCAKLFKAELFGYGNLNCESGFINGEDGLLFYQLLENVNTISIINRNVYYYWMRSTSSSHRLLVTEQIMKGMIAQDKFKFDFLKRNNSALEITLYTNLYNSVAYNSSIFPPKKVRSLYYESGLEIDVSLSNLSKYYKGLYLIKMYIKCHFMYYYNYIKSYLIRNRVH